MCGKSRIDRDRKVMKPELGFETSRPDVNVRRIAAFIRIKNARYGPQRRTVGVPLYNHFFHLKNTYGPTAASSIITSAIG